MSTQFDKAFWENVKKELAKDNLIGKVSLQDYAKRNRYVESRLRKSAAEHNMMGLFAVRVKSVFEIDGHVGSLREHAIRLGKSPTNAYRMIYQTRSTVQEALGLPPDTVVLRNGKPVTRVMDEADRAPKFDVVTAWLCRPWLPNQA